MDSDNSRDSGGDFRRSASARLPRNKNRGVGGDALNNTFNEESGDSGRSGEQVGVSFLFLLPPLSGLFLLKDADFVFIHVAPQQMLDSYLTSLILQNIAGTMIYPSDPMFPLW